MKKMLKIVVVLLMVASMLLCMAACGKDEGKALVGTWVAEFDLAETLATQWKEQGMDISVDAPFVFTFIFEFADNGAAEFYIDEEATLASAQSYADGLAVALEDVFYAEGEAAGVTREEYDEYFVSLMGKTITEFCVQTADEMMKEMESSLSSQETFAEGYYRAKDGMLYIAETKAGLAGVSEDDFHADYTLEGNVLTVDLRDSMDEDDAEMLEDLGVDFSQMKFVKN